MSKIEQKILCLDIGSLGSRNEVNEYLDEGWTVVSVTPQYAHTTYQSYTINGYLAVVIQRELDA